MKISLTREDSVIDKKIVIYIHIPFCKQKCSYCNFHFSTSIRQKEQVLRAIKKELYWRRTELPEKPLPSLYLGGGTPSILTVDEIQSLIGEVLKYFDFSPDIEITLEANPDDLSHKFLKSLVQTPINRLSIGTQSFFEHDLKLMNRAHTASQAEDSIKRAQDIGFENLSIDLIYGMPGGDMGQWQQNVRKAIALQVPHISSYALTVEPKTALNAWIEKGKTTSPEEDFQSQAFYYLTEALRQAGFTHYEISNFAIPGYHSRHNAAYWQYQPYLGLGPSAHSYDGGKQRSWNIANNGLYIKNIEQKILPIERETLSEYNQFNELLMIGLRTIWGVSIERIKAFPQYITEKFYQKLNEKIERGLVVQDENVLTIPRDYWFMADGIAADLFVLEG